MWPICKKEFRQFFSSLTGIIAISVFLLLTGLFLFVFPDTNIFDDGYATLNNFFNLAPWILLFLIPAITMRSFAEEFKTGTYEILQTRPVTTSHIILGKYLGCLLIVCLALLPTAIYYISVNSLSENNGIDSGASIGAYTGLFLLSAIFTAIGICCSSFSNNAVIAFVVSAFACFLVYTGFNAISRIPYFATGAGYYIETLGIDFHYKSLSRGVIDTRDVIYFLCVICFFLVFTSHNLYRVKEQKS